jgi:hypothetical protein
MPRGNGIESTQLDSQFPQLQVKRYLPWPQNPALAEKISPPHSSFEQPVMMSRVGNRNPSALTEPDVKLSPHPAPTTPDLARKLHNLPWNLPLSNLGTLQCWAGGGGDHEVRRAARGRSVVNFMRSRY